MTILNACTKKSGNLLNSPHMYVRGGGKSITVGVEVLGFKFYHFKVDICKVKDNWYTCC